MELDYALSIPVAAHQLLAIVGYIIPVCKPIQSEYVYVKGICEG
jgi:hypothetical protein